MFANSPIISFYDPLAELLGAGDGIFHYSFGDAVKLAGHACPTVAGGFLLVLNAVQRLYTADEIPQRGGLRITINAAINQGTTGPLSQIITLLTGAAADNGFHGLAGQYIRHGLLVFAPAATSDPTHYSFERINNGQQLTLSYNPSAIAADPKMGADMRQILAGKADAATTRRFRAAWRERVERLLDDAGQSTIHEIQASHL
ncbi:MAG: hypothetical protein WCX90_06945 [Thiohalomonadaceae bacterium]